MLCTLSPTRGRRARWLLISWTSLGGGVHWGSCTARQSPGINSVSPRESCSVCLPLSLHFRVSWEGWRCSILPIETAA